mgnify:CR=1 FL=1
MSTLQKLIVKGTHDELPNAKHGRYSRSNPLWDAVAEQARDAAGRWVAFEIPGRGSKSLGSARTHIKAGKYTAFSDGAWDAAVRGNLIYVRYLGEASAEVVDFKKAEVA